MKTRDMETKVLITEQSRVNNLIPAKTTVGGIITPEDLRYQRELNAEVSRRVADRAMKTDPNMPDHIDPDQAFDEAIAANLLSADRSAENFAGHYMYMGTDPNRGHMFKSINFRTYRYMNDPESDYPEDRPRDDDCPACRR